MPIQYSNVALIDPVTSAPVRSTWRYLSDGTKVRTVWANAHLKPVQGSAPAFDTSVYMQVRVSRGKQASGSVIPRPEVLLQRRKPRPLPGADGLFVPQRDVRYCLKPARCCVLSLVACCAMPRRSGIWLQVSKTRL